MRLRKIILSLGLSALMLTSAPLSTMEPVSVQAAACKHYHQTNYVVKAATCTGQGTKKRKCDDCGATIKTYTVPALGHKLEVKTTPATCLATGLSISTCKRCGKEIKREVLPKSGHNYVTKITKIATTTSEGESKTYCINCGYVKEVKTIPKKGSSTTISCTHPQKTTVVTKKPTCQSTGVQAVRCTTCNKVLSTTTLPKTGHSYVTKIVKKAGIYNEGLERIYCEYCGTVKEEKVIPKLTREVYISDTALSLTAGSHKTVRILYATHDVTWKSSNKSVATVDKDGRITAIKVGTTTISTVYDGKTYSCKLTVTAKPVSISATALSLQEGKQTKLKLNNAASTVTWKSSNTKVVTVDQYGNVVGVKAGTATVTATCGGQTYTCRMTITKASSTSTVCKHTNTTVETTNPTCTKAGSKVTRCKDCKKLLKTEKIAATGHKPDNGTTTAATCQKTGKIVYKCTVCGVTTSTKTLPKTSHNYVYKIITPATTTSTGKAKTYCTYCNKIKETTVIPKLTNTTKTMSIPLYLQANYSKVKYGDGTLATCGQGPTCLAMVASYKSGKAVTPADIVNLVGNKYYTKGSGTSTSIFSAANNYGIKSVTRTIRESEVIKALKAGKPVVSVQKKGLFTKSSTFIVLRGIDKNGKILVNSPEDTKKSIYKSSYDLSTQITKTSSTFLIIN